MLTCRTVYLELAPLVYSKRRFIINYNDPGNFTALRNLSPTALTSLHHLTVRLSANSCEDGWPCCKGPKYLVSHDCEDIHDMPLDAESPDGQARLSDWRSALAHMSAHIPQKQLNLFFICDVRDLETAKKAVEPLLDENFPVLASCNIRLGKDRDSSLENLARETAMKATGQSCKPISTSPFRFLDLPQELQCQVLEHTDLIAPCREVSWNPREGYYLHYNVLYCEGDKYCISDGHPEICKRRSCYALLNNGCFCYRHHAVFSTICNCWCPPTALFLVSKAFSYQAKSVFFSKNRFIVMPAGEKYFLPPTEPPSRLEASIFLRDFMAPDMLRYLRFLELVFPSIEGDDDSRYISVNSPAHDDWIAAIDYARDKLNPPALTVRVYFQDFRSYSEAPPSQKSASLTREKGMRTIVNVYELLVSPLAQLAGNNELGRCFIHAAWPWAWTPDALLNAGRNICKGSDDTLRWAKRDEQKINRSLERLVMKDDTYDGIAAGKKKVGKSQWLQFYEACANESRFDGFEDSVMDPWFLDSDKEE